jgi:VanZ family protein
MIPALVNLIIYLLVLGILYAIVVYVVDAFIPEPPARIIKVVAIVVIALVAVLLLLQLLGGAGLNMPRLT